jgi:large subunit ribosomal protein L25
MANPATDNIVLEVESRTVTGGSECRRMRREGGRIPGNVYGLDRPPFKVSVDPKRIDEMLRLGSGVNTVFQLNLVGENKTREAMIKELQRDPVSGLPVHVDFIRVDPLKKIQVSVPVRLVGTPEGVKNEGGVIDFVNRVVEVECLPTAIPDQLEVEVSALHINQNVSVGDLEIPEGVELLADRELTLAVVVAPRVEEVAVAAEEEVEAVEGEVEGEEKAKEGDEGETPAEADSKKD